MYPSKSSSKMIDSSQVKALESITSVYDSPHISGPPQQALLDIIDSVLVQAEDIVLILLLHQVFEILPKEFM